MHGACGIAGEAVPASQFGPLRSRRPQALALPDKPSIVVLPFDNMSAEPGQDYLADGIVEAITAALSCIRSFFVIARSSAFTYKGRATNVREIGKELGVAYLLEGSVQKAGNRLRIIVQLIETEGGAHVWSSRFDGAIDEFFDLEDRITEQVAGALQPSIRVRRDRAIAAQAPAGARQLRLYHAGDAACLGAGEGRKR